jgi:hypothetical protein
MSPGRFLQQFKSRLYAAWITTRTKSETFHASREFIGTLWNVCDNTLRQWESLSPVNVTPCYAEYAGNDPRFTPPKHAYLYARKDGSLAITWQLPNTYSIKPGQTIERHSAAGQSRKARKAHNQVIKALKSIQPLEQIGEGIAVPGRMYFETVKNPYETCKTIRKLIQRLSRRHEDSTTPRYISLGSKSTRRGRLQIYERYDMNTGFPHIDLNDRDYRAEVADPSFAMLKSASLEFGLTRGLRQMRWKSARKKTEPPVLVKDARGQVGEGDPPKNHLDILIQSDPLLKLGRSLGQKSAKRRLARTGRWYHCRLRRRMGGDQFHRSTQCCCAGIWQKRSRIFAIPPVSRANWSGSFRRRWMPPGRSLRIIPR